MKLVNFFVKLISSLFILIFGLLCLITTLFLLIRNMTSQENVTNYVKSANIFDYSSQDIILDNKSSTLRQTIKGELLTIDIPSLVVDEVIDSSELDIIISDYIYEYSQYIIYNKQKPVFPSNSILELLMERYNNQEGKDLSDKQQEKVLDYLKLLGNKIDQGTPEKSEIDQMISLNLIKKIANLFASKYIPLLLLIVIVVTVTIISICLGSIKKAINWCSKITVLNGIILIVASFVEVRVLIMYFNNQGLIDSLAISIVENGFQNMLVYGIALIVIGLIFMTISAVLLKKEKRSNNDFVNNKIEEQNQDIVSSDIKQEEQIENNESIDNQMENQNENIESTDIQPEEQASRKRIKDSEELQDISKISNNGVINNSESDNIDLTIDDNNNDNSDYEEKNITNDDKEEINEKEFDINKDKELQLISSPEEEKNDEIEEQDISEIELEVASPNDNEESDIELPIETEEYYEIEDEIKEEEPIKKETLNISPLNEIEINVTHPEKGKEIEIEKVQEQEEEEEIELL